jgi:hypothetical protein
LSLGLSPLRSPSPTPEEASDPVSTAETEDMKDTSASTSDMLSSVSNVLTPTSNANAASSALSVCAAEISMNRYVSAVSPSVSGCSVDPEYLEPGKSESGTNGNFGSDREEC